MRTVRVDQLGGRPVEAVAEVFRRGVDGADQQRCGLGTGRLLADNCPATRFLDPAATRELPERLPALRIAGGRVYDALVGATARHHGLPLATRDERAVATYRALDVDLELVRAE